MINNMLFRFDDTPALHKRYYSNQSELQIVLDMIHHLYLKDK